MWISVMTILISITAIIISAVTALYTIRKDHERSRREKALELVMQWSTNLSNNRKSSLARKYVEKFDEKQARSLINQEEIVFNENETELCSKIRKLLSVNPEVSKEYERKLTVEESSELRWIIICYLNMLESVLSASHHGVADIDIIREQFQYLYNPANGDYVLEKIRKACPGCYPATDDFYENIKSKSSSERGKVA